jgi:hypothetical protein
MTQGKKEECHHETHEKHEKRQKAEEGESEELLRPSGFLFAVFFRVFRVFRGDTLFSSHPGSVSPLHSAAAR